MENSQEYSNDQLALNELFRGFVRKMQPAIEDSRDKLFNLLITHVNAPHTSYTTSKISDMLALAESYDSEEHFNFIGLHQCLEYLQYMLEEQVKYFTSLNKLLRGKSGSDLQLERAYLKKDVYVLVDKLRGLLEFALKARNLPLDDLYCQPEDSKDWKHLRQITKYYEFSPKQVSIQNYQAYAGKVFFLVAAMGRGANLIPKQEKEVDDFLAQAMREPLPRFPLTVGGVAPKSEDKLSNITAALLARFIKYTKNPRLGLTDGGFFMANPDFRIIKALFNIVELKVVKLVRRAFHMESVKTELKHYIDPSIFDRFFEPAQPYRPANLKQPLQTLRFIQEELIQDGRSKQKREQVIRVRFLFASKLKKLESKIEVMVEKETKKQKLSGDPSNDYDLAGQEDAEIQQLEKEIEEQEKAEEPMQLVEGTSYLDVKLGRNCSAEADGKTLPPLLPVARTPKKPRVRLLDYLLQERPELLFDCDVKSSAAYGIIPPEERACFDRVVIHCHGGGFVAQSSTSHQPYMNTWVNEFKVPFFSIDYRLAPGAKFPVPLSDVVTAYLWILAYLEFVLGVKPRQIVAIGDSAGANLLTGLTTWCVLNAVRKPDCLFLFYPAMGLDDSTFTPSQFYSLDDHMLNYSGLRMCSEYYVGSGQKPAENFFLSSAITPDDILKRFPEIQLFLSERDPLRDDGMRFGLKASKAGAKVSVHYFEHLAHALLNMSTGKGLKEAKDFMVEVKKVIGRALTKELK